MRDYSEEIRTAINALGNIAYNEAREKCPVKTGRLKRSITLRKDHNRALGSDSAVIYTTVPYAAKVEFGGLRRRPKPFLENGIRKAREAVPVIFSLAFGKRG